MTVCSLSTSMASTSMARALKFVRRPRKNKTKQGVLVLKYSLKKTLLTFLKLTKQKVSVCETFLRGDNVILTYKSRI